MKSLKLFMTFVIENLKIYQIFVIYKCIKIKNYEKTERSYYRTGTSENRKIM